GAGTVGSIDTQQKPFRYTGEGDVSGIDFGRFGAGLDVAWLRDPRYAGVMSGHFHVDGAGSGAALLLTGGGRIARADMFKGTLADADMSIDIDGGTLALSETAASDFTYEVTRADLAQFQSTTGGDLEGVVATKGRLTGPSSALHAVGDATLTRVNAPEVSALTTTVRYDATVPASEPSRADARVEGHSEFLTIAGQALDEVSGTVDCEADRRGSKART